MYNVIVRDGTGHTFGFSYNVRTVTEARKEFKRRCIKAGIRKFKHIKIISIEKV